MRSLVEAVLERQFAELGEADPREVLMRTFSRRAPDTGRCSIDGCMKLKRYSEPRDLCKMHWTRWKRTGSFERTVPKKKFCTAPGCTRTARYVTPQACCMAHYMRWRTTGVFGGAVNLKPNAQCSVEGCTAEAQYTTPQACCPKHHQRWLRTGSFERGVLPVPPVAVPRAA